MSSFKRKTIFQVPINKSQRQILTRIWSLLEQQSSWDTCGRGLGYNDDFGWQQQRPLLFPVKEFSSSRENDSGSEEDEQEDEDKDDSSDTTEREEDSSTDEEDSSDEEDSLDKVTRRTA
jgi:hypothetical protein